MWPMTPSCHPSLQPPVLEGMVWHTRQFLGWMGEERTQHVASGLKVAVHMPEEGGNRATGLLPVLPAPGSCCSSEHDSPLLAGCSAGRNCSSEAAAQNSELGRTSGGLSPGSCSEQGWLQSSSASLRASSCPSENPHLSRPCPRTAPPSCGSFP